MSYYYEYYAGIEDKESKIIKPLGPYDCNGKLQPIISRSRSFASNLYENFNFLDENYISNELRKEFEYEDWQGNKRVDVKYLPIQDLPSGDYIVKGYFLIDDLQAWQQGGDDTLFYNVINPQVYSELMKKELIFGKNKPEKDDEDSEFTKPNASDYIYSAIPNYTSKEYEAELIRQVANMLFDYETSKKYNLIILETEG